MNKLLSIFALAILVGYLLILGIEVPSVDLLIVIGLTIAMAAWDALRPRP